MKPATHLRPGLVMIALLLTICSNCLAQNSMKEYEGHWEGLLSSPQNFSLNVTVQKKTGTRYLLQLSSGSGRAQYPFELMDDDTFEIRPDKDLFLRGTINRKQKEIRLMIRSVQWSYHTTLTARGAGEYAGRWDILLAPDFSPEFYVSVEAGDPDTSRYEAYCFSPDARFPGFACGGLVREGDSIRFRDFRTGIRFQGKLSKDAISLQATIAGIPVTTVELTRSVSDWNLSNRAPKRPFDDSLPADLNDGIPTGSLKAAGFDESLLKRMADSINANKITNTHSVLISRDGKLVYEQYFNGFDERTPHDMRSASKSIASAVAGIAIDQRLLRDTAQKLVDFLPLPIKQKVVTDHRKRAISIGNLLTMSSGLDAVDFGINRRSPASEDEYQGSSDWLKTIVEAPMIHNPGQHANYGSANPFLLGMVLDTVLRQPLDVFMDRNLFEPLGINQYIVFNDPGNRPYFGGGMQLRPRDMLKFGLLYANGGKWKNTQIVSGDWVEASLKKYLVLENHPERNEYGFLWWHFHYKVNGKTIHTIEARGAGGQYIFLVPDYRMVVVITSANFRNGRVWQPEKVMENYILPSVLSGKTAGNRSPGKH